MELTIAAIIGALYGCGLYMLLRPHPIKLIIGFSLLFNATNLLVFSVGGLTVASPPLIAEGAQLPPPGSADPLPQALVLTAIVISFGVLAFTLVLFRRACGAFDAGDLRQLQGTEER